jgi:hypothetical protein
MRLLVLAAALWLLGQAATQLWDRTMKNRERPAWILADLAAFLAAFIVVQSDPLQGWLMRLPTTYAASLVIVGGALVLGLSHVIAVRVLDKPSADTTPLPPTASHMVEQPIMRPEVDTSPARPSVTLTADGPYIVVKNTGAPATFRARLVATHAQAFPSVTQGSRFEGIWESTLTDKAEIATGDADRLMLGAVAGDHDPNVTPFHFYDVAAQRMGVREAHQARERSVPALSLELTLVSVPAISGGPKTYEFTVMQGRVEFLNEKPF